MFLVFAKFGLKYPRFFRKFPPFRPPGTCQSLLLAALSRSPTLFGYLFRVRPSTFLALRPSLPVCPVLSRCSPNLWPNWTSPGSPPPSLIAIVSWTLRSMPFSPGTTKFVGSSVALSPRSIRCQKLKNENIRSITEQTQSNLMPNGS